MFRLKNSEKLEDGSHGTFILKANTGKRKYDFENMLRLERNTEKRKEDSLAIFNLMSNTDGKEYYTHSTS